MDNDSSNELFSENSDVFQTADTSAENSTSAPPAAQISSAPAAAVLTEESVIEETVIPDTDAGGAGSCGEFLRLQREKLHLSYEDVFEATKLKPDMLRALEEENFALLPQPVYVIAYVKRLCQFYNINNALAREFMDKLRSEIAFDVPDDVSKAVKGSDESEENLRRIRNLIVVVVLVFLLLLMLVVTGITMVVINLRKSGHQLEKPMPFSENTLVELQGKPRLKMTELKIR